MLSLGLDADGMASYLRAVGGHHRVRTLVRTLTINHDPYRDFSDRFIGGQVDHDTTADVWTSGSVTLYDPARETGLAGASVDAISTAAGQLMRVFVGVLPPGAGPDGWVDVPVITASMVRGEQKGDTVEVELQSKSTLVSRAVHQSRTWPKGTLITAVIRDTLLMCGESARYIDLGAGSRRISTDAVLASEDDAWAFCYDLSHWLEYEGFTRLHYDARGVARVRALSGAPAHVFTALEADEDTSPGRGALLARPEWDMDTLGDDFTTRVVVTGKTPDGGGVPPVGSASAPASYPLAPANVRWNGVPLAWTRRVTDDKVTDAASAARAAQAALDAALKYDKLTVQVQALPLPHLEPWDRIRVQDGAMATEVLLSKASVPLSGLSAATYGGNRVITR